MSYRRLTAALPLTLAAPGAAHAQGIVPGQSKLRDNGIGKVFTGMTTKKARKAAGIPLERSRVGDRARKVRRLYKRLTSRPNLGGGRELVFKRGRHRLIFALAQGRVYRISGGRAPWVLQQECV
jgi:hypothetical protein